jgi:5-methyltetrahydrofolate--homocysteine methyltransferase
VEVREMANFAELSKAIIEGDITKVTEGTQRAVAEGASPREIIDKGLTPGMDVVGKHFKEGDMFIPEVLLSARAMHAGLTILKPLLAASDSLTIGRVVVGTIQGDIHDIGKSLVSTMLEGAGFEVTDLGVDVPQQRFAEVAVAKKANLVGMSALLTTTMVNMKGVIDRLEEAGVRRQVKIIIGGAPVTQDFANRIGADGYAPDAARAVDLVRRLLGIQVEEERR